MITKVDNYQVKCDSRQHGSVESDLAVARVRLEDRGQPDQGEGQQKRVLAQSEKKRKSLLRTNNHLKSLSGYQLLTKLIQTIASHQ